MYYGGMFVLTMATLNSGSFIYVTSKCQLISYAARLRHKEKQANSVHRKEAIYGQRVGQDSVVGIATLYGLDGPEIETRWG
jgi:hypothetical protein